jgi:nitrogen fixation protein
MSKVIIQKASSSMITAFVIRKDLFENGIFVVYDALSAGHASELMYMIE